MAVEPKISLACPHLDCKFGDEGHRWMYPEMSKINVNVAMQMLIYHVNANHPGKEVPSQGASSSRKVKLEKICRPKNVMGWDQGDFSFIQIEWRRYKDNSGETDTSVLQNHFLMCPGEDLHGSSLRTMSLEELMSELEQTAVEKQSSLLSLVNC